MQIDHSKLTKGQTVWYRYTSYPSVSGPFTVLDFVSDYEGRHVMLHSTGDERKVLLEDDKDFGLLLFYDSNPEVP